MNSDCGFLLFRIHINDILKTGWNERSSLFFYVDN